MGEVVRKTWPQPGDYVVCDDGLHMRVDWVAPPPLDVIVCKTFHRKDGKKTRAFLPKTRGKKWYPSDARGRRRLGDPNLAGRVKFDSMHPWEKVEMYQRILRFCGIDEHDAGTRREGSDDE